MGSSIKVLRFCYNGAKALIHGDTLSCVVHYYSSLLCFVLLNNATIFLEYDHHPFYQMYFGIISTLSSSFLLYSWYTNFGILDILSSSIICILSILGILGTVHTKYQVQYMVLNTYPANTKP